MAGYRYAEITPAQFAGRLLRLGEALWWTYAYTTMFESIGQGRWETVSDAVAELTGRPPASLPQVLSRGQQPNEIPARQAPGDRRLGHRRLPGHQ
jgi:hypothetical protein